MNEYSNFLKRDLGFVVVLKVVLRANVLTYTYNYNDQYVLQLVLLKLLSFVTCLVFLKNNVLLIQC